MNAMCLLRSSSNYSNIYSIRKRYIDIDDHGRVSSLLCVTQ